MESGRGGGKKGKAAARGRLEATASKEDDDANRSAYEVRLVEYNRRLASTRAECGRLEAAREQWKAAFEQARERSRAVLGVLVERIAERQASIEQCEAEKSRLTAVVTAYRSTLDAVYERRRPQYDKLLANLGLERAFVEGRFRAASEKNRRRVTLIDKISSSSKYINDLAEEHREGLYAAGQKLACQSVTLNYEEESNVENTLKTVIMNSECARMMDTIKNINEYNKIIEEMVKIKKKGAKTLKEYNDSVPRNADRKLDLVLYNDKLKMFERLNNATSEKVDNLLKKKNIAEFNKIRLIAEDLNREKKQKEYSIYLQTFEKLQSDIKKSKGLLYDLKQDIKTANRLREKKCVKERKKIADEIATITEELKKYINNKKQLTEDPTGLDWLLNLLRPLINVKIIEVLNRKKSEKFLKYNIK